MELSPRKFQDEDVPWLIDNPRSLLLYEPRMGKTVVTTRVVAADPQCTRILVVCSKNAMGTWREHFEELYPQLADKSIEIRYIRGKGAGAKMARQKLWLMVTDCDVLVYVITFAALEKDQDFIEIPANRKAIGINTIIGDEVHIRMKNHKNKTVAMMKRLCAPGRAHRVHLLSGTLAGKNGPLDFFACLSVLFPGVYTSYWKFVYRFMEVIDGTFGKEIISVLHVKEWHALLKSVAIVRLRKIEAPWMPAVQRVLRKVDADPKVWSVYSRVQEDDFAWVNDKMIIVANSLEATLRYRQLMCCPAMLEPSLGVGSAFEDFVERISDEDATEEDRHTVVFTDFAKALPIWKQYLFTMGFKNVFLLQGGMEPEDLKEAIDQWRESKGIILCTTKFAQAFSLVPATYCNHIGYSWDPSENKQAEDRLVPQQGTNPILSYYYCVRDTFDENVANTVNIKNQRISITLRSAEKYHGKDVAED